MKKKILLVIPLCLLLALTIGAIARVFDANKKWRDEHTEPTTTTEKATEEEGVDTVYWDDLWTKNY